MIWRNSTSGYGLLQILLHWLIAALITALLALGFWMTGLDYYHPWYVRAPDLHRAFGVILGLLLAARWAWRLCEVQPRPLTRSRWETAAAVAGHQALYLLPLVLVVSGYLISTADGRSIDVFGLFELPATLHGIDGQEDVAGTVHRVSAFVLLGLIGLHVAAALRHHFVVGDDTLRRIFRAGGPAAGAHSPSTPRRDHAR